MKKIGFIVGLSCLAIAASAQDIQKPTIASKTSFAIVVDEDTYKQTKHEIAAYQASIEQDGLGTYIILAIVGKIHKRSGTSCSHCIKIANSP